MWPALSTWWAGCVTCCVLLMLTGYRLYWRQPSWRQIWHYHRIVITCSTQQCALCLTFAIRVVLETRLGTEDLYVVSCVDLHVLRFLSGQEISFLILSLHMSELSPRLRYPYLKIWSRTEVLMPHQHFCPRPMMPYYSTARLVCRMQIGRRSVSDDKI